jgi:hypothetical protein
MPRTAVTASTETPALDTQGLTERQSQIIHLRFIEGMKMFRIAQVLRLSPKTVGRDLAAALDTLRTSEEEMDAGVHQQGGRVRMDITIAFAPDQVVTRPDTTLLTVSKIMTVPGFRHAFYAADSTPDRIKAIHAVHERRAARKQKKHAA